MMAEMGNYCKAYYVSRFRKFAGWKENTSALGGEKSYVDGKEVLLPKTSLEDEDVLYLQEHYAVTAGIFRDEHVVYDEVTDDWKEFCSTELGFEIPDYVREHAEAKESLAEKG